MSEKWAECPECYYAFYKYYEETDMTAEDGSPIYNATELPVVIKTSLGYLCRLCRHEWDDDGIPIEAEVIAKSIASFKKYGKKSHAEIQGLKGSTNSEVEE